MTASNASPLSLADRLRAREQELSHRLDKIRSDRRRSEGPLDPGFDEQVPVRQNDPVLDGLDEVERRELVRTRAALQRLEAGRLGICDGCGEPIGPPRIEADPAADCCIDCANAREQEIARNDHR